MDGRRGTLANEIAQLAKQNGTPWFNEVEEALGDHYTQLLSSRPTPKKLNYIVSVIRKKDVKSQLDRLENECPTTTGLFRQLNENPDCKNAKTYIRCNSHMTNEIRLIHAVRAGNSDLQG